MKKDEQIRMLLHPEKYTDEEIDQMLDEADIAVPDAGQEWERFAKKPSRPHLSLFSKYQKIAAMLVGVLMLSGIGYAAIRLIQGSSSEPQQQPAATIENTQPATSYTPIAEADSTQLKPVVFENAELSTILGQVAAFYHCETVYKNEAAKHVRLYFTWDKQSAIDDVVDTFNKFERFHITRENQKLIVE